MYISDSHTDFLTAIKDQTEREQYVKRCAKFGVQVIVCAVFTGEFNCTLEDIINFDVELKELSKKYNIKLLLSIEDLGFIKNTDDLLELIKVKPFSVTLTWNYANQFAGGAKSKSGLTDFGITAIELLEKNNILIDTAHLNRKSFYQFARITRYPLFNSHSNIYALRHHPRNLTDKQINMIVKSGGFIGLTLYDEFISNKRIDSLDVANQFDYLIQKYNNNCFGFGTDLYGIDFSHTPTDIKNYTDLHKIKKHLKEKGYYNRIIQKIMYKNFKTFVHLVGYK